MPRYWLTPVTAKEPLTLGAARLVCEPAGELEQLRERLGDLHPRLLPMFKASLLPGDEDEGACGSEEAEPDWAGGADIVFDGAPLALSHCGEAFIDRLLSPREALALLAAGAPGSDAEPVTALPSAGGLNAAGTLAASGFTAERWLGAMTAWLAAGYEVILLREDG